MENTSQKETEDDDLEEICVSCGGEGHDRGGTCWNCKGSGYSTTEKGEKIVALIRHQLRSILAD